ncbi:hypothetical protein LU676_30045 [Pseudomonas alloputida]|uniref:hypothetical protein n=1 Tax=Pseudomonas putida group TaxID=136845 RepID=UPI000BF0022E|nr:MULTISPECIES: hypothetical protein [Pseudomonas putida group]MCE0906981.1 hypothetical protein [Pseudomonas alloputida]MDD2023251.1 hypothetical protein [Pseudomonas putida]PEI10162.1 hypothetical protein CRM86_20610 [Pseudomonas putida]
MFKRLVHFFTSRNLEKHRQQTQCMINEYERQAAASQARVQAQADAYKLEIQQLAKLREEELNKYMELLTDHIGETTNYIAQLKELAPAMFLCIEAWLRKDISEQRWKLERDKRHVVDSTIVYLGELTSEIVRLSRKTERRDWQAIVAERPPRVMTPEISKHTKHFMKDVKGDAQAYDEDLQRIDSYQRQLRKQLRELRTSALALKVDMEQAREQHRQARQQVQRINESCGAKFRALQEVFENYFQFSQSESPLANEWLSQMPHGGNLREIKQVLSDTKPDWELAKNTTSHLNNRRKNVQSRIDRAYQDQEYSSLDAAKAERSGIFEELNVAREHQNTLYAARQVFVLRRDEINKLMDWINDLHPSKTIEQVFGLLARDDAEIYWPAIGLATKAVRPSARRHQ